MKWSDAEVQIKYNHFRIYMIYKFHYKRWFEKNTEKTENFLKSFIL